MSVLVGSILFAAQLAPSPACAGRSGGGVKKTNRFETAMNKMLNKAKEVKDGIVVVNAKGEARYYYDRNSMNYISARLFDKRLVNAYRPTTDMRSTDLRLWDRLEDFQAQFGGHEEFDTHTHALGNMGGIGWVKKLKPEFLIFIGKETDPPRTLKSVAERAVRVRKLLLHSGFGSKSRHLRIHNLAMTTAGSGSKETEDSIRQQIRNENKLEKATRP